MPPRRCSASSSCVRSATPAVTSRPPTSMTGSSARRSDSSPAHRGEPALHSHVTGILPSVRATGLGRELKLHQQAWAAYSRAAMGHVDVRSAGAPQRLVQPACPRCRGAGVPRRLLWPDRRLDQRPRRERSPLRRVGDDDLAARHADSSSTDAVPAGAVAVATPDDIVALRRTSIHLPPNAGGTGCATSWADRSPPAPASPASPVTASMSWRSRE